MEFDWASVIGNAGFLARGMSLTLLLVAVATVCGLVLGVGLAMVRLFAPAPVAGVAGAYVGLMRSVPLILLLFWFYFFLPLAIGRPVGALSSALIAYSLFEAAFYCEIVRAGLAAVSPGQMRAALASGLRRDQALRLVVMPQAVRAMRPVLLNQIILVFQDTSLVYVVSLRDFMTSASIVATRDGRPMEMYMTVAVVYLVVCLAGSMFVRGQRA